MERCWRCLTGSVDPEEEIGLCRACRADLSASNASGTKAVAKREDPRRRAFRDAVNRRGSPRTPFRDR
jgi:hypothetical protein